MAQVTVSVEAARGCGYRKPAKDGVGIYLVSGALSDPCGLLPYPLEVCPCCGGGVKAARSWTWITPTLLFVSKSAAGTERDCASSKRLIVTGVNHADGILTAAAGCPTCPIASPPAGKHGLLWIGEGFYATADDFTAEASRMGVSRKIKALPKGFVLGETWVYLAHRNALLNPDTGKREFPGIFSCFKPKRVDLVIADENQVPEKAERLAEKLGDGARIIRVIPDTQAQTALDTSQPVVH